MQPPLKREAGEVETEGMLEEETEIGRSRAERGGGVQVKECGRS